MAIEPRDQQCQTAGREWACSRPVDRRTATGTGPIRGRVHSVESMGALDGPGLRYVLFLQGCPLRCAFCHNRDTWSLWGGQDKDVDEVWNDLLRYQSYMQASGGGVTVSGGEPALQAAFVAELFRRCREAGIHTALDTSGYARIERADVREMLSYTDLVLMDIKAMDPGLHRSLTGVDPGRIRRFASFLADQRIPVWIRVVLIPGITTTEENLVALASYVRTLPNVERVELLPYTKLGDHKWAEQSDRSPLAGVREADQSDVERAAAILKAGGLHHVWIDS
ncbi:MAG: pyruvate formate lyase-activating protein [Limnochordales bacterium]|nr:pyruvate formate lyase-activating protein [Limnochordales bacterium]